MPHTSDCHPFFFSFSMFLFWRSHREGLKGVLASVMLITSKAICAQPHRLQSHRIRPGGIYFRERNSRAMGRSRSLSASVRKEPFPESSGNSAQMLEYSSPRTYLWNVKKKKKKEMTNHAFQITAILLMRDGRVWYRLMNTNSTGAIGPHSRMFP